MSSRRCRALDGLSTLTDERIMLLMTPGPKYAESTLRKHDWVLRIYGGWCNVMTKEPFPLDKNAVRGFIKYLGEFIFF